MKTLIFTILALAVLSIAIAPTLDNSFAQQVKPDKPGKPDKPEKPENPGKGKGNEKCNIKVQLKVINAPFNSTIVANLEDFPVQNKTTGNETSVTFMFKYNKDAAYCPSPNETLFGWVNDVEYEVEVLSKLNKKVIILDNTQFELIPDTQF